jgi:hypothetical protein
MVSLASQANPVLNYIEAITSYGGTSLSSLSPGHPLGLFSFSGRLPGTTFFAGIA